MSRTPFEKQDSIIAGFQRTIIANDRNPQPNFIQKEVARGFSKGKAPVKGEPKPRISFYNPTNPLNGFGSKTLAQQKEILEGLKQAKKGKK